MKKILKDKQLFSIILILVIGLIVGTIFFIIIKYEDKELVSTGIKEYITLIKENHLYKLDSFINIFLNNFLIFNIIFIASFLIIFTPLIYLINLYKGFIIGFTFSSFIYTFNIKGIFYFLINLFPNEYLLIILLILFSSFMIKNTKKLLYLFKNDKSIKVKNFYLKFSILYFIMFISIILISLSEVYINSYLLSLIF